MSVMPVSEVNVPNDCMMWPRRVCDPALLAGQVGDLSFCQGLDMTAAGCSGLRQGDAPFSSSRGPPQTIAEPRFAGGLILSQSPCAPIHFRLSYQLLAVDIWRHAVYD